jgi:short-subunit dehydrogenase
VLTIKPGFVDTPMTAEFPKGLLWAQPDSIAKDIFKGISSQRNVIYTPWFWTLIMVLIRLIPESIFKRLKL